MFVCLLLRMGASRATVMLNSLRLKLLRRWATVSLLYFWYSDAYSLVVFICYKRSEHLTQPSSFYLTPTGFWHQMHISSYPFKNLLMKISISRFRHSDSLTMTWWGSLSRLTWPPRGVDTPLAAGNLSVSSLLLVLLYIYMGNASSFSIIDY
jgi:hypothetical protein